MLRRSNRRRIPVTGNLIQSLEPRRLLAAVNWDGGGDGVNWTNALNWSTDALPGVADDVTISLAANPTITLNSGIQTINSLTCNENFNFTGGTLSLAAASSINGSFAQFNGTLNGVGDLTINGTFSWNTGSHAGTGRTIIPAGQTIHLSAGQLARRLDLSGTMELGGSNSSFGDGSGANGTLNVLAGAVMNANGSLSPNGGTAHALNNSGTINHTNAGIASLSGNSVTVTNNGTIDVNTGTLNFTTGQFVNNGTIEVDGGTLGIGNFTNNDSLEVVTGATLNFTGNGTHNAGSVLSGAGSVSFSGGGTHTFPTGTFTLTGQVTIAANVNFTDDVSLSGLVLSGNLGGSGDVTVNGPVAWSFGKMTGSGTTVLSAGQTLTISSGANKSLARRLDIAGTANLTDSFSLSFGDSSGGVATVNVPAGGTLNITGNQSFGSDASTGHAINNSGTINRAGPDATSIGSNITLTNNNTINLNAGPLTFSGTTLVNNGTINVAASATLSIGTFTTTHNAGSTLSGTGPVSFSGGTHSFAANAYALTGSLALGGAAVVTMAAGSTLPIRTSALSITGTSRLDLNDNDLILDYTGGTQLPAIQSLINSARGAIGAWTGNGLTSSAAKNANPKNTTLGAMEASDFKSIYGSEAPFSGVSIDTTAVLVKYTYYGDADFNGAVNFDDYSRTDSGFNNNRSGWLNGDFDANGSVNFDDYSLLDLAFNTQGNVLRGRIRRP